MTKRTATQELDVPEMAAIRGGSCPASILRELKAALDVSDLELAAVVGIPRQTMLRRLKAGTLKRHEADRVVAVAKAYNKALEFFGKHETAVQWMKLPNPGLDGESPLERADTVTGANDVVVLLHRVAHGIPL
jgi:putative toxin-antitoxin system antitoxin component (TIGR02293 family)